MTPLTPAEQHVKELCDEQNIPLPIDLWERDQQIRRYTILYLQGRIDTLKESMEENAAQKSKT